MLVTSDDEIDAAVVLSRLLDGESNVVVEDFFDGSALVGDFPSALVPLNCERERKKRSRV